MKKLSVFLTAAISITLMILTFIYGKRDNFSLIITLGIFLLIFSSYFYFEKSDIGTKEIGLIATLSAFSALSRIAFAPFPNVKPTTFIVAISGLVFGPYEGFLVGCNSAFISNIFLGQGPWTPWQMFSWGLVGVISGFMGKGKKKISAEKFAFICFLYGFMFDWIMNLWHVLGFIRPLTLESIGLAYLSGLTFDILHATSSFVFCIIFYDNFLKILMRFKRRLQITYIE